MKHLLITAAALALLTTAAQAENWTNVATLYDGTIMEIDTDSIKPTSTGGVTLNSSAGGNEDEMVLDCNGHYGRKFGPMTRIPHQSIIEQVAATVCKH